MVYSIDEVKAAMAAVVDRQFAFNERVTPDWVISGLPYWRALNAEAGEAIGHLAWPWWSSAGRDLIPDQRARHQLYLELADCLAFGVSTMMARIGNAYDRYSLAETTAEELAESYMGVACSTEAQGLVESLESIQLHALKYHRFLASELFEAAATCGLGLPGLLAIYHGKTILNHFRQENGYKEGKYRKQWLFEGDLVEDNVVLASVIESWLKLHPESPLERLSAGAFAAFVRSNLAHAYNGTSAEREEAHEDLGYARRKTDR